jgi:hypothetical protein
MDHPSRGPEQAPGQAIGPAAGLSLLNLTLSLLNLTLSLLNLTVWRFRSGHSLIEGVRAICASRSGGAQCGTAVEAR